MTQLTRERLVKDTRLMRKHLIEYMKPKDTRDAELTRRLYDFHGWTMDEYMWDEHNYIVDMISTHSHGNEKAERFLCDFMYSNRNDHYDFIRELNNTMSHFITLVTGIPQPKSTAERMRLKRQEQDRIAQSRQRPPPRKKGQRKKKNTAPKGGGGGKQVKQRDIDSSAEAYKLYKERKK